MYGKLKKKRIALLLLFIIISALSILSFPSVALARQDQSGIVSAEECKVAAGNWLRANYNDGTAINEVIPVMDAEGTITSYSVDFIKNGQPNGYIVYFADKNSDQFIREFSFTGKSIYNAIVEGEQTSRKVLFDVAPYSYAAEVVQNGKPVYKDNQKRKVSREHFRQKSKEKRVEGKSNKPYYDGFFGYFDVVKWNFNKLSYTISNADKTIHAERFIPELMTTLQQGPNNGNCGPTAVTNCVLLYKYLGYQRITGDANAIYRKAVALSGFDESGRDGTDFGKAAAAASSILNSYGYTSATDTYWLNLWSDFTRDLYHNYAIFTFISGYNYNQIIVGHFVITIGFLQDSQDNLFLQVLDGWNTTTDRYIWFGSDYFTKLYGKCILIWDD